MTVTALYSFLLMLLLTATAHCTPTGSLSPPSPASFFVEPSNRGKQSSILSESAQFAPLVNYNHKATDTLVDLFNNTAFGKKPGSSSSFRANVIARAVSSAAAPSKDILPFCVAISTIGPSRTRIFKNKQICDRKGWRTMFVFTAHTKMDIHHAPYPVCAAISKNTSRPGSMFFVGQDTCTDEEWRTEFVFYMSGRGMDDIKANPIHESTMFWKASGSPRMMFYPYYDEDKVGWKDPSLIMYRSRWRLAVGKEIALLRDELPIHAEVHKRIEMYSPPDTPTHRCIQNLIQVFDEKQLNTSNPRLLLGRDNTDFVGNAERDEHSSCVISSWILLSRKFKNDVASLEVALDNKVYAAVSFREKILTSPTIVTFGDRTVFTEPVPNA
ncbi:hypothetical protein BGZ95_000415 [Linnemannia exigua]|uniref:Uncharacterized protein n=1 Tax=Linnemannia exigua TaxID=604196 RepID=A0AAD4D894_9FUNG|nr:hypothetical protein BGZ95_000415 [Linnemannia exigua]